ncbi:MAG: amidohydrolase family protein, partial [Candidatus Microthrix subdominans]|nr:amidohydrolase family protein [Candidatus Microthrix sp.]
GSKFLGGLFDKLRITARKMEGWWAEDPVETFRRHIWINPFWEDDVDDVIELMGADRVIFGSDWPHIEALPRPLDYLADVAHLDEVTRRKVLLDNVTELNTP